MYSLGKIQARCNNLDGSGVGTGGWLRCSSSPNSQRGPRQSKLVKRMLDVYNFSSANANMCELEERGYENVGLTETVFWGPDPCSLETGSDSLGPGPCCAMGQQHQHHLGLC